MKTLLEEYLEKKLKDIAPSYINSFKKHIETAINFFGNTDIRDIRKKNDIENYKKYLESFKLGPKTIKNYLTTLKTFFHHIKERELIDKVPSFPEIESSILSFRWLSVDDQVKIFEHIPQEDKAIFAFLFLTGQRLGEARGH